MPDTAPVPEPSARLTASTITDPQLNALYDERDQLAEHVRRYERAITWETSCLACARALDSCHTAEADRDRARRVAVALENALASAEAAIARSERRREADGADADRYEAELLAERDTARRELTAERERHTSSLRHADEHLGKMNAELQRYAAGDERPVLWSVYNAMHLRAANAEAALADVRRELATMTEIARGNKAHVQRLVPELDRLTALVGEYADRGITNGQRADAAEAAIERVRAECRAIDLDVHGKNPVALAGLRTASSRIRAALDGPTPGSTPREPMANPHRRSTS